MGTHLTMLYLFGVLHYAIAVNEEILQSTITTSFDDVLSIYYDLCAETGIYHLN